MISTSGTKPSLTVCGNDAQEVLPSYAEASTSSHAEVATPGSTQQQYAFPSLVPQKASRSRVDLVVSGVRIQNIQRYSSLLPPSEEVSSGPPPNYEAATSSLPDRIRHRPESPELPESRKKRLRWLHIHHHHQESSISSKPPKQEGVPLEEVVDRFGNRKRELRMRTFQERMRDPVSVRSALRSASKIPGGFKM